MTEHKCFGNDDTCPEKPSHKFEWPWGKVAGVCPAHLYAVAQTATNLGLAAAPLLVPLIPASAAERAHNFLQSAESLLAHAHATWMRLSEIVDKFHADEQAMQAQQPVATPEPAPSDAPTQQPSDAQTPQEPTGSSEHT